MASAHQAVFNPLWIRAALVPSSRRRLALSTTPLVSDRLGVDLSCNPFQPRSPIAFFISFELSEYKCFGFTLGPKNDCKLTCVQRGFGLDRKTVDKVCGSIQNRDAVTMAVPRGVLVVLEDNVVQGDRISELLWLVSVFNEHWLVLFADASGSSRGSRATNLAFWVAWKMGEHVMCPLGFHATWARQFLRFWRRRRAFYF